MSTSLYYEPVIKREAKSLANGLKYILGPTYWGHDGTLSGEEVYLTEDQLKYLCGIRDGTRDEQIKDSVNILIKAIQKYGSVRIWLES